MRFSDPRRLSRWRLRRRDRSSAARASTYGTLDVLREASLLLELAWARGGSCTGCARDRAGHGGATGSGLCLVGALAVTTGDDRALYLRVVDMVWHQLHAGHPRRTANWNSPATRHALQLRDLRRWNDTRAQDAGQAAALLRVTWRDTRSAFGPARSTAPAVTPPDPAGTAT